MSEDKQVILEVLDQGRLLLPRRLHEALDANGRVKFYLSLLQLACARADAPDGPAVDLSGERIRVGIDEPLEDVVSGARRGCEDRYRVPRLREVVERIDHDLERMLVPIAIADGAEAAAPWRCRMESVRQQEARVVQDEGLTSEALAWLTSADPSRDGPHRLCMDLHKAVDEVEARFATESLDGARAFGLEDRDRALVRAFMRGLHRTEALKLDHPGLGTTATRSGARLVLENDIGATDAHVLVVTVEGLRVVVTTADVHVQRLAFFQRILSPFQVAWQEMRSRRAAALADDEFFLCSGTFDASREADLAAFLEHLGSRLVFLIDWNKARKALQSFVPKSAAVPLLHWAAEAEIGHRAFLELGGDQLVYDAMAAVIRTPVRFGERLEDAIEVAPATDFLRFVLRETADGLRHGRSRSLIRERVRAELANAFAAAGERLVEPVRRHAAIVQELASTVLALSSLGGSVDPHEAAARAKAREREADDIVVEVRSLVERIYEKSAFGTVVDAADDAADEIEETIFSFTLLADGLVSEEARGALKKLGELVEEAAGAWVTCVEAARHSGRGAAGTDMPPFLEAVDRVETIERETDDARRRAIACMIGKDGSDPRVLFVATQAADHLEAATDALLHAALALRDCVSGAVMIERNSR